MPASLEQLKSMDVLCELDNPNGVRVTRKFKLGEIPEDVKDKIISLVIFPQTKSGSKSRYKTMPELDEKIINNMPNLRKIAVPMQFGKMDIRQIKKNGCPSLVRVIRSQPKEYSAHHDINFKTQNVSVNETTTPRENEYFAELLDEAECEVLNVYDFYSWPKPTRKHETQTTEQLQSAAELEIPVEPEASNEDLPPLPLTLELDFVKEIGNLVEDKAQDLNEEIDENQTQLIPSELYAKAAKALAAGLEPRDREIMRRSFERIDPHMSKESMSTAIPDVFKRIPSLISAASNDRELRIRELVHFLSSQENTTENVARIAGKIEQYLIDVLLADPKLHIVYLEQSFIVDGDDFNKKANESMADIWEKIKEYLNISQNPDRDKVLNILGDFASKYSQSLSSNLLKHVIRREKKLEDILQLTEGQKTEEVAVDEEIVEGDSLEDEGKKALIPSGRGKLISDSNEFSEKLSVLLVKVFNKNIHNLSEETLDRIEKIVKDAVGTLGMSDIQATLDSISSQLQNMITREGLESLVKDAIDRVVGKDEQGDGRSISDIYSKLDSIYEILQEKSFTKKQVEDLLDSKFGDFIAKVVAFMDQNSETSNKTNNILELLIKKFGVLQEVIDNNTKTIENNSTVIENNTTTIENNTSAIANIQNFIKKSNTTIQNNTTLIDQLSLYLKELEKQKNAGNVSIDIDVDNMTKVVNLIKQMNVTDNTFSMNNVFSTVIQNYLTYSMMTANLFNNQVQIGGLGFMNPFMIGMQNTNAISNVLMMSMLGLGLNNKNVLNLFGGNQPDPNQTKMMELLEEILKLLQGNQKTQGPSQTTLPPSKTPSKTPSKDPVKAPKPVKIPEKTKEFVYKERVKKSLEKLREPKRKENLFAKIARHPIKTALTVAGIGAAIGLGAYALLPATMANVVAGVPLISKVANLAIGAAMPVGIGAGAGLAVGGVTSIAASVFKGVKRERLYKKFQRKYNRAMRAVNSVELAKEKVSVKQAEKEALRDNLRSAKNTRQRNKALRALAKKRKQISRAKNKEAKVTGRFTTKVREALNTKSKLNAMESRTGKTTALGGAVQYVRSKQGKLDPEAMADIKESLNEELSDLTGSAVDIDKVSPKHKTYDREAVDLISMVNKLKASNEFNSTLSEIEARHTAIELEDRSIQQYDVADIQKMIAEADANPSPENVAAVNAVIDEYNKIQDELAAKGYTVSHMAKYYGPMVTKSFPVIASKDDGADHTK